MFFYFRRNGFLNKYSLTIGIAITAFFIIFSIMNYEINFLKHSLYVQMNLLRLDGLIRTFLMTKIAVAVALYILGISCLFMFYFSYDYPLFMELSRLCFLAAAYAYTVFELETVFFIDKAHSLFWLRSENISAALFFLVFLIICYKYADIKCKSIPWILRTVTILYCICVLTFKTKMDNLPTMLFLPFVGTAVAAFVFLLIRERKGLTYWFFIFPIPACCYLLFIIFNFKSNPIIQNYNLYIRLPWMIFLVVFIVFIMVIKGYRSSILYSRETNRKIQEVNKLKEEFSLLLSSQCLQPVSVITGIGETIVHEPPGMINSEQKHLLMRMLNETNKLKSVMKNINDYTLLQGNSLHMSMVKINFNNIMDSAIILLTENEEIDKQYVEFKIDKGIGYVMGDPYRLLQIFQDTIITLYKLEAEPQLFVEVQKSGKHAEVSVKLLNTNAKMLKRMVNTLNRGSRSLDATNSDFDFTLAVIRHLLKLHGGSIWVGSDNTPSVSIRYAIPLCKGADEPESAVGSFESVEYAKDDNRTQGEPGEKPSRVVIASGMGEQAELLLTYLRHENLKFRVFNDGKAVLKYLEKDKRVSLVIIGSLFTEMGEIELCNKIRNSYSIAQLPIMILRQEKARMHSNVFPTSVNDFLIEPFDRKELIIKVNSLILLKNSVDDALKSRLRLLQSQMNPHFIFNAISAIMRLCIQNPMKAYELLGDFSDYLRANLFFGEFNEFINIQKEIDYINAYLKIEKARYGDNIRYHTEINCDRDFKIPPLFIEPIVENSVIHGAKGDSPLIIDIEILQKEEFLYVTVKDNGRGMSPKKVLEVLSHQTEMNSVGLKNLKKRLMIYYGETINIASSAGAGTVVSYRIPKERINDID